LPDAVVTVTWTVNSDKTSEVWSIFELKKKHAIMTLFGH